MNIVDKVTMTVKDMGACDTFEGRTLDKLIEQLFTPQGLEFVMKNAYPDLDTFRKFKKYDTEKLGVYIDCGDITLTDPERVFLIGDTRATLNFTQTRAYKVRLMFGAKATVNASGYSVVNVAKDRMSRIEVNASDDAQILQ
jgi:hypothetical protein